MLLNSLFIFLGLSAGGLAVFKNIRSTMRDELENVEYVNNCTINSLVEFTKNAFSEYLNEDYNEKNLSQKDFERLEKERTEFIHQLKEASYGNMDAKRYVKEFISNILQNKKMITKENINAFVDFNNPNNLTSVEMMWILSYAFSKYCEEETNGEKSAKDGLEEMIKRHHLARLHLDDTKTNTGEMVYDISAKMIKQVFIKEKDGVLRNLDFLDKVNIIVNIVYSKFKGFGPVEMLIESSVDEIDCGVSGVPYGSFDIDKSMLDKIVYSYESIWIMWHGLNVHFSALKFESQAEFIRVCQNIYKYDAPTVLSRKEGRIVSTMKDGSRIVVVRPPFADSYAFFLRKFGVETAKAPEDLFVINKAMLETSKTVEEENPVIEDSNVAVDDITKVTDKMKEEDESVLGVSQPIEGSHLLHTAMKWLIRGHRNILFTGSQGTGKTTTMKSYFKYVPVEYNTRIQELSFELNLRYLYPNRNIVAFQETADISTQIGLDTQKKTNGSVNIIGEIATAEAACWIIQTAKVASLFTWGSHHAKTAEDLVTAIRDNLLQLHIFSDATAAEAAVADVINFDAHMEKDVDRKIRFLERLTEIVPIREHDYPSDKLSDDVSLTDKYMMDMREQARRTTDRKQFRTQNIIEFRDDKYVVTNMITEETIREMRTKVPISLRQEFDNDMKLLKDEYLKNKELGIVA